MKYFNSKRKIYNLFSLLFAVCLLSLASCPDPFDAETARHPAIGNIPPGMGSFSLTLSGASRTIMPETPLLSDFTCLELAFMATAGGANKTEDINNYNGVPSLPPVALEPGTYSLTVNAYKGPGKTNLAARGTLTEIVINPGQNTSESVTLKALLGEGTGTFKWDIKVPDFVDSGNMTLVPLNPSNGPGTEYLFLNIGTDHSASGRKDGLASGVYNVKFDFRSDDKSLQWYELVYIYSSLDTNFEINFTDDYFNNTHHTVTVVFNNEEANGSQSVLHGGTVWPDAPDKTSDAYLYLGTSATPGFTFAGWYTDAALNNQWYQSTQVTGDITLYAKWTTDAIDLSGQLGANDVERAIAYVNANAGAYTLYVVAASPINVRAQTINADLTIQGQGGEKTIQYSGAADFSLFTISAGASLTLGNNITLKGITTGIDSLVKVAGGTLTMQEGSKITGHTSGNDGGGVFVNGGTFNMNGGSVSGNEAVSGGGVYMTSGTFTMSGSASVSSNTTENEGGGVSVAGGNFTMSGGEISENKSLYNSGGGVYVQGTFTMSGGKIFRNAADSGYGGGVSAGSGAFNMNGSAEVSGNTAYISGGGVFVDYSCTFTVGGTAKVSGNTFTNSTTPSNVYLLNGRYITLDTGSNAPKDGMKIYVQTETPSGVIVESGANGTIANYFKADRSGETVDHDNGKLKLVVDTVPVAVGTFTMGNSIPNTGEANELPAHQVTLTNEFSMSKYQVTQAQWRTVMTGNRNGINAEPSIGHGVGDDYPVYYVSWYETLVFCNRLSIQEGLNPAYSIEGKTDTDEWGMPDAAWDAVTIVSGSTGYRLPTEAQWEYAAKGGNGSPGNFTYSGSNNVDEVAWYSGNNNPNGTKPVGTKAPNGLGLYDMSGNVWELCWDWFGNYSSDEIDPTGPSAGSDRVIRGGGYRQGEYDLRSVRRGDEIPPYLKGDDFGFRVVLVIENFKAGTGTSTDPFLVRNEAELRNVGTETGGWTLSAQYKQTADITLDSSNPNNWTAIGSDTNRFTGTYNGNGYTITNLNINTTTLKQGLFSVIGVGGIVENLGLIDVNIRNEDECAGGIAGFNYGTIQNCYVSGSVTNTNKHAGGIAGYNGDVTIDGVLIQGTIQNCYFTGNVTSGNNSAGGITSNNQGFIRNCVALNNSVTLNSASIDMGRVSCSNYYSGARQNNYAWSGMTLTNSNGTVTPTDTIATGKDGADLSAAQVKTQTWWTTNTYWDFTNVWQWNTNGMPSLRGGNTVVPWPGYLVDVPAGTQVTGNGLTAKLNWLSASAASNTSYTIEVEADESISPQTLSYSGRSNITVILWGKTPKTVSLSSNGTLFEVKSGVTLVLYNNITLQGRTGNNASLVTVDGSTLEMNNGTKITGNTCTSNGAGGVRVDNGEFIMNGGEISGISDDMGAVCVMYSTFTMSGGRISNNNGLIVGGVFVGDGSSFIMEGGEISGNTANTAGGVYFDGACTFRKTAGIIYGSDGGIKSNTVTIATDKRAAIFLSPAIGRNTTVTADQRLYLFNDSTTSMIDPDGGFDTSVNWALP